MSFVAIIIDFLHLLGTITWIGGITAVVFIFQPSLQGIDPKIAQEIREIYRKRFTIISFGSILVLIVTGFLNFPEGSSLDTLSSSYRAVFLIKVLTILVMIIISVLLGVKIIPQMKDLAPKPGEKPTEEFMKTRKLSQQLGILNFILGVIVVFLAAALMNNAEFT